MRGIPAKKGSGKPPEAGCNEGKAFPFCNNTTTRRISGVALSLPQRHLDHALYVFRSGNKPCRASYRSRARAGGLFPALAASNSCACYVHLRPHCHRHNHDCGPAPRVIAKTLNTDQVPGPTGKTWGRSTIHGNKDRGTSILNNEI
jgi:hypothetical protein